MLIRELRPSYPVAELDSGAFFTIGYMTTVVPPGASTFTLATPADTGRRVREAALMVFRKEIGGLDEPENNVAFLGVGGRAEIMDHPAFEPVAALPLAKIEANAA